MPSPVNGWCGFSEAEALRLDHTPSLLARAGAPGSAMSTLSAPADSVLRRVVGAARQQARPLLTQRMAARLSAAIRDRLDVLVAVDDDQPHSPLHRIKTNLSNHALCDTLDQAVDMCRKLLDRNRKVVEDRVDDTLKTQRHAVDRVVHRYHRLGTMLSIPTLGDPELRVRLLAAVLES